MRHLPALPACLRAYTHRQAARQAGAQADVICQLLKKRDRRSDQRRYSLSQGAVKSLAVIGFAALLFDHLMLLFRYDTRIRLTAIRIESSLVPSALLFALVRHW